MKNNTYLFTIILILCFSFGFSYLLCQEYAINGGCCIVMAKTTNILYNFNNCELNAYTFAWVAFVIIIDLDIIGLDAIYF